jgi:hypothetical protein
MSSEQGIQACSICGWHFNAQGDGVIKGEELLHAGQYFEFIA